AAQHRLTGRVQHRRHGQVARARAAPHATRLTRPARVVVQFAARLPVDVIVRRAAAVPETPDRQHDGAEGRKSNWLMRHSGPRRCPHERPHGRPHTLNRWAADHPRAATGATNLPREQYARNRARREVTGPTRPGAAGWPALSGPRRYCLAPGTWTCASEGASAGRDPGLPATVGRNPS